MASLSERVEAELANVEAVLKELPEATSLAGLSTLELAGVAALLSSFYNGIENVVKQVLLARGQSLPDGASWHRDLLVRAVDHEILSAESQQMLTPFMAFRHFFTHAYAFDLHGHRIEPLAQNVRMVFGRLQVELRAAIPLPADPIGNARGIARCSGLSQTLREDRRPERSRG